MPELSHDVVVLLQYLVPGFIAASVFYATTAYAKPSQFERIVQALIFTVIVQATLSIERNIAYLIGYVITLGAWSVEGNLVASIFTAVCLGSCVSVVVNRDMLFVHLRQMGATQRSSYPSEWVAAFSQQRRFVMLNLKDGSRLSGWPSIWPQSAKEGHFYVTRCTWIEGSYRGETRRSKDILINVADVAHVEFLSGEKN